MVVCPLIEWLLELTCPLPLVWELPLAAAHTDSVQAAINMIVFFILMAVLVACFVIHMAAVFVGAA